VGGEAAVRAIKGWELIASSGAEDGPPAVMTILWAGAARRPESGDYGPSCRSKRNLLVLVTEAQELLLPEVARDMEQAGAA